MPTGIREDGKARRIAIDILGVPISGFADSSGKKKKSRKKKRVVEEEGSEVFKKNESYGQEYYH